MASDSERHEAARRLRELEAAAIPDARIADHAIAAEVIAAGVMYDLPEVKGLFGRLADLIEPSGPKVRCVAEVKVDSERLEGLVHDAVVEYAGVDRDALLAEANELEKCAGYFGLDFDEDEPLRDRLKEASEDFAESARRIREALGVDDD